MAINPAEITTIRVDQLADATLTLDSLFPHTVGTELKSSTIQELVDLAATAIGVSGGVGFLAESRTDGQTLPAIPTNPSFMLVGVGTFVNLNGYPDLICTEELNALMSLTDHWEVAVEIPIAPIGGIEITNTSQLVNDGEDGVHPFITLADLPSNLILYPTNVASDIGGYSKIVTDIHDVDYNEPAVDISTGAITTTSQLVASLATAPNLISGNPGVFNITTLGNIKKVSGNGEANFYFQVYKRTGGGTETLIGTSSNTEPVTLSTYVQFLTTAIWDDGTFTDTDRIVLKFYANRIAGGTDPTYNFQFGGETPVRTLVPIPLSVVPINGVQTVTGTTVDNTDALNPIVNVPTLQQVTDAGNETTDGIGIQSLIIKAGDAYRDVVGDEMSFSAFGGGASNNLLFNWVDNQISFTKNVGLDNGLYELMNTPSATPRTLAFTSITKSANFTAENDQDYTATATLTVTDPTPVTGKGFQVHVIGGTSTIGGVGYTAGALVYRYYDGAVWVSTNLKQSLQNVLDFNHDLLDGNNFQGTLAGDANTGTNVNGFGADAGNLNTGSNVNLLGSGAGYENSGDNVSFLGTGAGDANTGSDVVGIGQSSASGNTANHVNVFGSLAGTNNTFKNVNLFGFQASADAENQNVFSKWVSGVTKYLGRLSFNNITADRKWEFPDASGNIALISDTITDGVTTIAPSQNAVFDALATKVNIWKSGITGATVTNTLTITPAYSQLIPAGTFVAGDAPKLEFRAAEGLVGKTAISSLYFYVNTANNLSGATQLGISTGAATNIRYFQIERTLAIKGATTKCYPVASSASTDNISANQSLATVSIDWTVDQYILFAIGFTVADQTLTGDFYKITK